MITRPNVKINLGLNVLRKREDGFHELDTLFVPYFGIHDTLEIVTGDDFSRTSAALFAKYGPASAADAIADDPAPTLAQAISADGKLMITIARAEGVDWNPLKDLCARAYALLDADFDLAPVKIYLEKTSPVGAGLGGGSADAAFALRMLNDIFALGLDDAALAAYASRLGSDCAFFIYNTPMLGQGRGEILTPYSLENIEFGTDQEGSDSPAATQAEYRLVVITPEGIAVSTAEAYSGIRPAMPEIPLSEILAMPVEDWKGRLKNDFETTVFAKHPELAAIKQSLYDSGAVYASMSGSGSALFAIYKD